MNKFPKGFLWGGAISANQAEGAFDKKGMSVADIHRYNPNQNIEKANLDSDYTIEEIIDNINDTENYYPKRYGIDFYHTYKEDIKLLAELGIKTFRTSIDWSRIYPNGDDSNPNEEGLQFYDNLFDELRKHNIEPLITMLHYETPLNIALKYGGWSNKEVINLFLKYANTILKRYKNKVKYWIVINQIN